MQINSLKWPELTSEQIRAWSALQRADSTFASPFFRPEFAALVAGVRPEVEVAVFENGRRCVGFWPYHRDSRNVAHCIGLHLSDYEGMVIEPELVWPPEDVLRQCGLAAWSFGHLIPSLAPLRQFHWSYSESPVIDVNGGFDKYREQKRRGGSLILKRASQKFRKIEREVGEIRFLAQCKDRRLLDTVIELKRAQYRRIRSIDHLAAQWTRELLRSIAEFDNGEFAGMLSALFAGDHLVAAHLGIRSGKVLHGWFPVYDREFEKYSPGMLFWIRLVEQSATLGIETIDLGCGDERYKGRLKTGDIRLAEGAVDLRIATRGLRRACWWTGRLIRSSTLAPPLRCVVRSARAIRNLRAGPGRVPRL
jgi:CelD/BcsL family acetyltransferase involved in cellulose biosynthesis